MDADDPRRTPFRRDSASLGRCRPGQQCRRGSGLRGGRIVPVILGDANLLVQAHVRSLARHERVRAWLDTQRQGIASIALPRGNPIAA